jgi:hypothetical protein
MKLIQYPYFGLCPSPNILQFAQHFGGWLGLTPRKEALNLVDTLHQATLS